MNLKQKNFRAATVCLAVGYSKCTMHEACPLVFYGLRRTSQDPTELVG